MRKPQRGNPDTWLSGPSPFLWGITKPKAPYRLRPPLDKASRRRVGPRSELPALRALLRAQDCRSGRSWLCPIGHPQRATQHEGYLSEGALQPGQPSTQAVLYMALLCFQWKHPTLPFFPGEVQFLTWEEKGERSCPWAQMSVKRTVTAVAHSFCSRQGLLHFILSRWPSSQRVNGLFCNSHLTPENEDRPRHS